MDNYNSILVVNLGGIGDLMLSTPALRAIRAAFPGARLWLLSSAGAAPYARSLAYFDGVCPFILSPGLADLGRNLRTMAFLRAKGFDLAVNMRTIVSAMSRVKMQALFRFISAKKTAGRDTAGRGNFFEIRVPEHDGDERYEMEYDLAMAAAITGSIVKDTAIDFDIGDDSLIRVRTLLAEAGIGENDPVVGFHIGGKQSHAWPVDKFLETARLVAAQARCTFVVTGAGSDRSRAEQPAAGLPMLNLAGRLELPELGALIRRCAVFVSPDSAPMHIAAALKTPLVAVFGPGYLRRFDPRNIFPGAVVLYEKVDCAPCNRQRCASRKCLAGIRPARVAETVVRLLREGDPR